MWSANLIYHHSSGRLSAVVSHAAWNCSNMEDHRGGGAQSSSQSRRSIKQYGSLWALNVVQYRGKFYYAIARWFFPSFCSLFLKCCFGMQTWTKCKAGSLRGQRRDADPLVFVRVRFQNQRYSVCNHYKLLKLSTIHTNILNLKLQRQDFQLVIGHLNSLYLTTAAVIHSQ